MIYAAVENGKVSAEVFRSFRSVKKTLVKGSDVRTLVISADEYKALLAAAPDHLKGVIAMGYHTGMRRGEILGLTWDKADLQQRMIFPEAGDTKDQEPLRIAVNSELLEILNSTEAIFCKC